MTANSSRGGRVVVTLAVVVALTVWAFWWFRPIRRIDRQLDALRLPDAVRLVRVDTADNGWLCIDSCSWQTRSYHADLGVDATAGAVAAAFRDRGFAVEQRRCAEPCHYTAGPMDVVVWDLSVDDGGLSGWVFVGPRGTGTGVEVTLAARG